MPIEIKMNKTYEAENGIHIRIFLKTQPCQYYGIVVTEENKNIVDIAKAVKELAILVVMFEYWNNGKSKHCSADGYDLIKEI